MRKKFSPVAVEYYPMLVKQREKFFRTGNNHHQMEKNY